jgi:hypothetical protein
VEDHQVDEPDGSRRRRSRRSRGRGPRIHERGGISGLVRLIRDHGDAVEADLAFRGIDFRDLWRRGSGLTLRRLHVLLLSLPADARLFADLRRAAEKANKPSIERLRERQRFYDEKAKEAS